MAFFSRSASRNKFKGKKDNLPLLPASMQGFLARRVTDVQGGALAVTGIVLALSLLTFDSRDPSFNTAAAGQDVNNLFGRTGAYMADMLLQTLGLSSRQQHAKAVDQHTDGRVFSRPWIGSDVQRHGGISLKGKALQPGRMRTV